MDFIMSVCVCVPLDSPTLQKRKPSSYVKLRAIIKTIKFKISKKILNRLDCLKAEYNQANSERI